jgi:hypothetical protein
MTIEEDKERYQNALHAMQTGVQLAITRGHQEANPKHLRVGVNSAMVGHSALARILINKGIITAAEYYKMLADVTEEEVATYRRMLNLPDNVELR